MFALMLSSGRIDPEINSNFEPAQPQISSGLRSIAEGNSGFFSTYFWPSNSDSVRSSNWIGRLGGISAAANLLAGIIALLACVGWIFSIEFFVRGALWMPAMHPLTALLTIILCLQFVWATFRAPYLTGFTTESGWMLAVTLFVFVVAVWQSLSYPFQAIIPLDTLIFPDITSNSGPAISRTSAPTSLMIVALSLGMLASIPQSRQTIVLAKQIAVLVGIYSIVTMAGHIYGAQVLYGYTTSVQTAVACLMLSAGLIGIRPEEGWIGIVGKGGIASRVIIWLLPTSFVIPFILGALQLNLLALFNIDEASAVLFQVVAVTFIYSFIVLTAASEISSLESRQNNTQDKLTQTNAALEQAVTNLKSFNYLVSHDLKSPLQLVMGYSDPIKKRLNLEKEDQISEYIDKIQLSIKRMSLQIDELLDVAKAEAEPSSFEMVNLVYMLEPIVKAYRETLHHRSIDIRIGQLPVIPAVRSKLRRVFTNLIDNAVKYTHNEDKAIIEVGVDNFDDTSATIFVRDNGVGFPSDLADRIFDVFSRAHKPDEFEGTGIGLANVKRIVEQHNGQVWAISEPNGGSTFFVQLPTSMPDQQS